MRAMLVWCPDWPVVAAQIIDGVPAEAPVAVMHANRVVVSSGAARAEGVRRGLRKREAQARCARLILVDYDPGRDMRAFEPVVAAVEQVVAGVAVLRPGVCAFAVKGPARYLGGEDAAGEQVLERIAQEASVEAQIGVADGTFAALLAARMGRTVPPGGTAEFLAPLPVSALERPALVDLLTRLGVRTLGEFAALGGSEVLARFGLDAALAHRLARGLDDRPLEIRQPPPDLEVELRPEDPIERVDMAAFAARGLAERLHEKLTGHGLACTRLGVLAVLSDGQELFRMWRHEGVLTAAAISERARWQLDGWLSRNSASGGIVALRLVPDGILAQVGLQSGLWGEAGPERDRANRAVSRVQGMLGPDGVLGAVLGGGRDPLAQVTAGPWGEERIPERDPGPWPGALPPPLPAVIDPVPVSLLDAAGEPVTVDVRLALSGVPHRMIQGGTSHDIAVWSRPWPVDELWWDARQARRLVRMQAVLGDGRGVLLTLHKGQWSVWAVFD